MKLVLLSFLTATAVAFTPASTKHVGSASQLEGTAFDDMVKTAEKSNPLLKYFDPIGLGQADFWGGVGNEATVGFLRHSEIKHGRIAMFAFVGYIVQSNIHFPWSYSLDGSPLPDVGLSPEAQWDALPVGAKQQIFAAIACLEIWDEMGGGLRQGEGLPHYMNGRKPGDYPSMVAFRDNVHFALDLYDPLGLSKNKSEEAKENGLISELNNGRLAMIGIMGFLAADKVPGSVPLLVDIARPYSGEAMAPFSSDFSFF